MRPRSSEALCPNRETRGAAEASAQGEGRDRATTIGVSPYAVTRSLPCDRAIISIYPSNGNVVRPSPVDDLDSPCAPVLFVQDGAGPFYGCVLTDRLPSVDPHATFVLARVTGEDYVDAVIARLFHLRIGSRFHAHICRTSSMYAPAPEKPSAGHTKIGWAQGGDHTSLVKGSWREADAFYGELAARGSRRGRLSRYGLGRRSSRSYTNLPNVRA